MSTFSVILAAAGRSSRFNDPNCKKTFAMLNRKPVWLYSADLFLKRSDVKQIIVVISPADKEEFIEKFAPDLAVLGIELAIGGNERADSVENALAQVNPDCKFVVIHDAARPCIDADLIESVFQAAMKNKAAVPAIAVNSTLKRSADGKTIDQTVDRTNLYQAQTPQAFDRELILSLYANRAGASPTDEAQLAEQQGQPVTLVPGSPFNIKITTQQDLAFAQACLEAMPKPKPKFDAPLHPFADDNLLR